MPNSPTVVTLPDKKTELFVKLQMAVDGSHGMLSWSDIAIGAARVAERKRQESVTGLVSSLPLADLLLVEEIAHRELGFATTAATKATKPVEIISDKPPSHTRKEQKRRAR